MSEQNLNQKSLNECRIQYQPAFPQICLKLTKNDSLSLSMVETDVVVVVVEVVVDEGSGTLDDSGKGHKYETSVKSKHLSKSFNPW